MADRHRAHRGDLAIRGLGLGSCALSCAAFSWLVRLHAGSLAPWSPGPLAFLLTAIGFLAASAGSAMVLMGAHLFDEIEVSDRWRRKPPSDDRATIATLSRAASIGEAPPAPEPRSPTAHRIAATRHDGGHRALATMTRGE